MAVHVKHEVVPMTVRQWLHYANTKLDRRRSNRRLRDGALLIRGHDRREAMARDLREVLGEEAPHCLEQEVAEHVVVRRHPVLELLVEVDDVDDSLASELRLPAGEHGLVAGEEEQRVVLVGQVDQVEHHPRRLRVRTRLPDLEPAGGAEHDPTRRRRARRRVGGVLPVVERLLAMGRQPAGLGRRLHLDQAHARPDQVDERGALPLLEGRDILTSGAVTVEKLVQEALGLAPLPAVVHAPLGGQHGEPRADLLAGQRHPSSASAGLSRRRSRSSASASG
ncbi:MAG TPA: hypothetical protein VML35_06025 [Gaiellaceae bacterium]|nr:hypothetical protein [Gaiellaceae bacterium]